MSLKTFGSKGLTESEVQASRTKYGLNALEGKPVSGFTNAMLKLVKEPMILLLLAASVIYVISGNYSDAIFLSSAIVIVSAISLFQDSRSRNALEKLKKLAQPTCKVIRNKEFTEIKSVEVVVGDYLVVEEGTLIAADGEIVHSNDFSVNESILTGESLSVFKDKDKKDNLIFSGTSVASGLAIAKVTNIGNKTKLGLIGVSLNKIQEEKTPLEKQISDFVKKMALAGLAVFILVWAINFFKTESILDSLLKALTLAMSVLPEEIPMAFTAFMALGAWRLMKTGVIVKQMKTVETLGSATVLCIDKTGTITENRMSLAKVFSLENELPSYSDSFTDEDWKVIEMGMWASEPIPFDPMEIALHDMYSKSTLPDKRAEFSLLHEYLLSGKPPMMTHIFQDKNGKRIIAAKGAPEAFWHLTNLNYTERLKVEKVIQSFSNEGFRVLAVAQCTDDVKEFPATQQELAFKLLGILAFYDPPKKNMKNVLQSFYQAGIQVKIITGDNKTTTTTIASQIGFKGFEKSLTGDELMKLSDEELDKVAMQTQLFCRMFPEAKLRIIQSLKRVNQVVAMTGDGVNDGPALKAAHIGIAMGNKGTEIAKQAASLILIDDDLSKMVDAVAAGRKIYANLKKAIQYIISIHIPIILTVVLPLALGWMYPNILSPVHIIFLELIMGPTCSIIYENEPIEKNAMLQKPRTLSFSFFNLKELTTSIIQGLVITAGTLAVYQYAVSMNWNEEITRTMVFTVLVVANIFLTLVNRSFYFSVFTTIRYKNTLVYIILALTILMMCLLLYMPMVTSFFKFQQITPYQVGISISVGFLSVIWFECIKLFKRVRKVSVNV